MTRIVIPQSDIPVPADFINKLRFKIVSGNRNLTSAWSVINLVQQETLYVAPPSEGSMPPGGLPGETIIKTGPGDYDAGWEPIANYLPDDIVYSDSVYLVPPGGDPDDVLTKVTGADYDMAWLPSQGGIGAADPQDGNLVIGLSVYL